MKKKILLILVLVLILTAIVISQNKENNANDLDKENPGISENINKDGNNINPDTNPIDTPKKEIEWSCKVDGEQTVTRAQVAKMLSLANYGKTKISQFDREISFPDSLPEHWYDKYINASFISGWMLGIGDNFKPLDLLTYSQAQGLASKFGVDIEELPTDISTQPKDSPIILKHWIEIYNQILLNTDLDKAVESVELIIIGTPANINELKSWEVVTDKGKYSFEGLTIDKYIDTKIKVLRRDNEILAVLDVTETNPLLTNAWIVEGKEKALKIFMGGAYRTYESKSNIDMPINNVIGDIQIVNKQVDKLVIKPDKISGKVLMINNTEVEIEGYGKVPVTTDSKVYDISSKVTSKSMSSVIVGYKSAEFVIADGKVCAALIKEPVKIKNIRVLLNGTDFNGYVHSTVKLTCDSDYTVMYGEQKTAYKQGDILEINPDSSLLKNKRITIKPNNSTGKVQILSIQRGSGSSRFNPAYRGFIEISKTNNGLNIVNEVPFEEYLYAVVPSEMPTSYGIEAAKVQAVCARSYAYNQFYANKYSSYGAHVDDSVLSQVYNNTMENDTSIKAVKDTSKLGLNYNGNVISAYFFSTSSGHTSNSGEVWAGGTKEFPSPTPDYLIGKPQTKEKISLNLSSEEDFAKFIKNIDFNSYDKDFAWYRWNVTMTREELEASINKNIEARYNAAPRLIKVLSEDNKFRSRPISTIGTLKDIKVYSRGTGGLVTEILIIGSEATVKVTTEYNIRLLLAPKKILENGKDIVIDRKDGSKITNFSMLPSAFFIMEKEMSSGAINSVKFIGGGYGHGVGMSQNGVKAMVESGYSYDTILKHYYSGIEIKQIY